MEATEPERGSTFFDNKAPGDMRVSALITTFNRVGYVQRAIDSVLAQTLAVDEVIVIDDGSVDGTAEIVTQKYGAKIRLIRQQNSGVSGARGRAIREATCEWVAFLDSDDVWTPERNQLFCSVCKSLDEDVAWVFGDVSQVADTGIHETIFEKHGLKVNRKLTVFPDSLRVQFPFQFGLLQASIIRRNALLEANCFSQDLRHSEDVLAGFQIAVKYKFAAVREVVTRLYRTSDLESSSTERAGMNGRDYYRARMTAFRLVIESKKQTRAWEERYAEAVRGLCKLLARQDEPFRRLCLEQFRFSVSGISLAFLGAALLGHRGLRLWAVASRTTRAVGCLRSSLTRWM